MVRDSGFLYVEDINITNSLRVKDRRQRKEAASCNAYRARNCDWAHFSAVQAYIRDILSSEDLPYVSF